MTDLSEAEGDTSVCVQPWQPKLESIRQDKYKRKLLVTMSRSLHCKNTTSPVLCSRVVGQAVFRITEHKKDS